MTSIRVTEQERRLVLVKVFCSDEELSEREKAVLMIIETERALEAGTKHFDINGKPLNSVREILEALARDGSITFEP